MGIMGTTIMGIGRRIRRREKVRLSLIVGTQYYANGDKYEGDWSNDMRNGEGIDELQCLGTLAYVNGDRYEGQWKDDEIAGQGMSLSEL